MIRNNFHSALKLKIIYLFLGFKIRNIIVLECRIQCGDDLISQIRSDQFSYYHYDAIGSTRSLTNDLGNATDAYNYEAFGNMLQRTGNTANNYLFVGEQFDPYSELNYFRARYYNPRNGLFSSMDPIKPCTCCTKINSSYAYANQNPVNILDYSGKAIGDWLPIIIVGLIIILGALIYLALTNRSRTRGELRRGGYFNPCNAVLQHPGQHTTRCFNWCENCCTKCTVAERRSIDILTHNPQGGGISADCCNECSRCAINSCLTISENSAVPCSNVYNELEPFISGNQNIDLLEGETVCNPRLEIIPDLCGNN
jgi:RHS repeat-associated protein